MTNEDSTVDARVSNWTSATGTKPGAREVYSPLQAIPRGFEARIEEITERARQDERGRIARDLHDDVVHQLVFLVIDVDLLRQRTGTCHPDMMRERLDVVLARVQAIGTSVRDVAHRLKTTDVGDLEPAVRRLCQDVRAHCEIEIQCIYDCVLGSLDGVLAIELYRIVQEALQNIVKHSGAGRVTVEIARQSDAVVLRIVDDGAASMSTRLAPAASDWQTCGSASSRSTGCCRSARPRYAAPVSKSACRCGARTQRRRESIVTDFYSRNVISNPEQAVAIA